MDCLTFISKLVEAGAWPTAAVILVFLLRREIKLLAPLIKRLKAGPLEVELHQLAKELEQTKKLAESAEEKAEIVANKLDEGDASPAATPESVAYQLTDPERTVLNAIANSQYAMRSITGIAKTTGFEKSLVSSVLNDLIRKGLVKQTKNQARQLRWYPSNIGRSVTSES